MIAASERRWTLGAWLTLAAAAGLLLIPVIATVMGLGHPTDGWTSFVKDSGVYELLAPVSLADSPLQTGDLIVAINGRPLQKDQLVPLPSNPRAGQVVRYTLERGDQTLDVDVTLVTRSLPEFGRYSLSSVANEAATTLVPALSFIVALAVFLLRPGSMAARYLLIIFAYYGPGNILTGAENHLYNLGYPLPLALGLAIPPSGWTWVFFPSLILLALSLPVRLWPLSRFPRLLPVLLYGVPFTLNFINAYLLFTTGSAGLMGTILTWTFGPIVVAFLAAVFGGLVYNFRTVHEPVERAQLRWIALGMGFGWGLPLGIALVQLLLGILDAQAWATTALWLTILLPISLAVAITRYGLFDIDVIIRRTLVYSVLTGLLAFVYLGSVLVIEGLLRGVVGGNSQIAIVVSTLVVAALFGPLRVRVQQAIDRRFFRRKYDATRTLATFGAQARDETNLESLSEHLVMAVDGAMQPAHVGLWMRKAKDA
jgi:hypothetical protein